MRSLLFPVFVAAMLAVLCAAVPQSAFAAVSGILIDDTEAELQGQWSSSTSVKPFVGKAYLHDGATGKGSKSAKFTFRVPIAGEYELLIAYTPGGNRAKKVPVTIESVDGSATVSLDQSAPPQFKTGFHPVGRFNFSDTADGIVLIETTGTTQHVVVDGLRLLSPSEFSAAQQDETQARSVATKPAEKKVEPPKPQAPKFVRQPASQSFSTLTAKEFDALLLGAEAAKVEPVDDIKFLRRATLDLIGRQPSLDEYHAYLKDNSATRRSNLVERLLASDSFGKNWAAYWSDVIAARQEQPQLTYLNYDPFRAWLQDHFNRGIGWDETVFQMLTAVGTVGDGPAGAFIGFHQGERNKLAGESARVFLGLKIGCAQCHDHPFVDMPQETFHGMAAFFARTKVKLPWNDSNGIEISSDDKGEHKMPSGKGEIAPTLYRGESLNLGVSDLERREKLAYWVVSGDNPFFARSFVNHIQARLLGRGFFDPIDDLGEGATALNPEAHQALAAHFAANEFDVKSLFRLLASTRAYQSQAADPTIGFGGAAAKKLRGDEVFDSLAAAIELPNSVKEIAAATEETRFQPPPKSTRDIVNEVFGYDPATKDELVTRTMQQAIFMMNNSQLQQLVSAEPESNTVLSRLLAAESDDQIVLDVLYARVLSRAPTAAERAIVIKHLKSVPNREGGWEDVLWSLLNSAEFTTRN